MIRTITERFDIPKYDIFNTAIAQAKGSDVLIFRKLDTPIRNFSGKFASYELEYRWLSCNIDDYKDAETCVQGNDFTLWTNREFKAIKEKLDQGKTLFDCINLY